MPSALDSFFQKLDAQQRLSNNRIPPKLEAQRLADELFLFLFPMLREDARPASVEYALLRHELMLLLEPLLRDQDTSM